MQHQGNKNKLKRIGLDAERLKHCERISKYVTGLQTTMANLLKDKQENSLKLRRQVCSSLAFARKDTMTAKIAKDLNVTRRFIANHAKAGDKDRKLRCDILPGEVKKRVVKFYFNSINTYPVGES